MQDYMHKDELSVSAVRVCVSTTAAAAVDFGNKNLPHQVICQKHKQSATKGYGEQHAAVGSCSADTKIASCVNMQRGLALR